MTQPQYQVIIVGAGPAGISAAARAHHYYKLDQNFNYLILEKGVLANTIETKYHHGKHVMALPTDIPLRSDVGFHEGSREDILEEWHKYVTVQGLQIQYGKTVTGVTHHEGYFVVTTTADVYTAANVVLAIGKDGNPRKLTKRVGERDEEVEIQPELKDQVRNALDDPRNYADQAMLIVGAGDSAAEVALALSEQGNRVVIACRTERFDRMNESLREKVYALIASHSLTAYYHAQVKQITKDAVTLRVGPENRAEDLLVPADWVFLQIGAEAPKRFLQSCGVHEYEEDQPILGEWYEPTGMPGFYLIGAVGSAGLIKDA